jgi:lipopolysaccharide export system protein LptA
MWFGAGAIVMIAIVAGMYFYAQWRLRSTVRAIPGRLGVNIQQTTDGFSISHSVDGRTQFTVSASKEVQFKKDGHADLHDVKIIVYGKDGSRFDRIAGDNFEFDPNSGNVAGKGRVLIDLQANPEGVKGADQSAPAEVRTPLHLETDDLVFNKNSGDASAKGKVEFQTPQAKGSAVGMQYTAKTGTMILLAAVEVTVHRPQPVHLEAAHGVITKEPHQVFLTTVHVTRDRQEAWSDQATFFLRPDDTVERVLAEGDVRSVVHPQTKPVLTTVADAASPASPGAGTGAETHERSDRADLFLTGSRNLLTKVILTGDVQLHSLGSAPSDAFAGMVTLNFAGEQILQTIHAEDGVRLTQKNSERAATAAENSGTTTANLMPVASASGNPGAGTSAPLAKPNNQDIDMTAPVMDFYVKDKGRLLDRAETSGPPKIVITQPTTDQKTVVTAVKFVAHFTEKNRLATLHGEPDAKIVSTKPEAQVASTKTGAPAKASGPETKTASANAKSATGKTQSSPQASEQVSTSQMLDVVFLPEGGVKSIMQTGNLVYVDGTQKAWAARGEYTSGDEMIVLTGSPRVVNDGTTTTAQVVKMNRASGDAMAEGNVKSTYSDLKPDPNGAMLASSDPIHVTSRSMTAHKASSTAVYTGDARLWQNANVVVAPVLEFDRDKRTLFAHGDAGAHGSAGDANSGDAPTQPVSTVLVQVDKDGNATPTAIHSARLNYSDPERKVFCDGGVTVKQAAGTVTGQEMTAFLRPREESKGKTNSAAGPASSSLSSTMPGQIDRIIGKGNIVIVQPMRRATGERLDYTASDDRYVLTGGPPSIFDAEHGKTTGDSLTFYKGDDRVLVDGRKASPVVTKTQVAR